MISCCLIPDDLVAIEEFAVNIGGVRFDVQESGREINAEGAFSCGLHVLFYTQNSLRTCTQI